MGFSHADRVFVIGDADCEPSTIKPEKKGSTICYAAACCCSSAYFQEVDKRNTRTATLTRLWSVCRAAVTTAASTPSAVLVVAIFRRLSDDFFFLKKLSMLPCEYIFSGGCSTTSVDVRLPRAEKYKAHRVPETDRC